MKKKICGLLLTGLALTACGDLSGYMRADRNAPFKTRLRACMLSEANDKLQNGTLLDKTLKETADEIADDWRCNRPGWTMRRFRRQRAFSTVWSMPANNVRSKKRKGPGLSGVFV